MARTASTTSCGAPPAHLLSVSPLNLTLPCSGGCHHNTHTDIMHDEKWLGSLEKLLPCVWYSPKSSFRALVSASETVPFFCCVWLTFWPNYKVYKGPCGWVAAWHHGSHSCSSGERQTWQCVSLWAAIWLLIPVCTWDLESEQASGCSWRRPLSTYVSCLHTPFTSRFPRLSYMLYTHIDDTGHTDGQNY